MLIPLAANYSSLRLQLAQGHTHRGIQAGKHAQDQSKPDSRPGKAFAHFCQGPGGEVATEPTPTLPTHLTKSSKVRKETIPPIRWQGGVKELSSSTSLTLATCTIP